MKKALLGRIAALALTVAAMLAVGVITGPTVAHAWTYTAGMDVRDCLVWKDPQTGAEYYRVPAGNYTVAAGELTKGVMLAPSDPNSGASGQSITLRIKGEVTYNYQGAAPESTYMIDFYNYDNYPVTIAGAEGATIKLQNGAGLVYSNAYGSSGKVIQPRTTIKNITFDGNGVPADNLIYFNDSDGWARDLTIENCSFVNFRASTANDKEYSPFHSPVQIRGGASSRSSGTDAPIPATANIENCTFKNNEGRFGGALVLRGTRTSESAQTMNAYVTGCTFENNSATGAMGGRIELAGTEQCVSGGSIAATSGTHVSVANTTITGGKVKWKSNTGSLKNSFAGGIALESRYAGVPAYCELTDTTITGCDGYGVNCHRGGVSAFGHIYDYGKYGEDNVGLKLCGTTSVTGNHMGDANANVCLSEAGRGFYTLGLADDFTGHAGISVDFSEAESKWISQGVTNSELLSHISSDDPTHPIKLDGDRVRMDVHEHSWKYTRETGEDGNTTLTIWCENEGCKRFSTDGVPSKDASTGAATLKLVPNKTKYDQKAIGYRTYINGDKYASLDASGLPVSLSVDLYAAPEAGATSGGTLAPEGTTDAGNYYFDVTATVDGTEEHWQVPFAVAPKPLSECYARIDDPRPWYDGKDHALSPSDIHVYFGSSTKTPELERGIDYTYEGQMTAWKCGYYTITMTGQGNYTGTASDTWSVFTKNSTPTLQFTGAEVDYDGEQHTLEPVLNAPSSDSYQKKLTTITYGVEGEDGTIAWGTSVVRKGYNPVTLADSLGDAASFRNAGTYTIWAKVENPGYYPIDPVKATLTIKPRKLTLEVANASRTYGDENPVFQYNITSGEVLENDDLQIGVTNAAERRSDWGSNYPFTATLAGADAVNYTVSFSNKLTIEKRIVTVAWDNLELPYNFREQAPWGTVSNVAEGDELRATTYAYKRVGTYTTRAWLSGSNTWNYEITEADREVTYSIVKAHLSAPTGIKASATSVYGKPDGVLYSLPEGVEWRAEGSEKWSTDWAHNLAAGTYYVRFRDCKEHYQSEATKVVIENGPKIAINLPSEEEQVGYTITADPAEVEWGGSTTLHITFEGEFGKLGNFAIKVDGTTIPVDDDGVSYSIYGIKRAVTITVEGVGDTTPPTGTVTLGADSWSEVQTGLDFGSLVVASPVAVSIEAQDGSGVKSIEYIDSASELSESALKKRNDWISYENSVEVTADGVHVIYFKVTDLGGNTAYLSTAGFTVDANAPVIQRTDGTSLSDGAKFCVEAKLKIIDEHDAAPIVTDNGQPVDLDENGAFTLAAGQHKIVAVDAAGNKTELELSVAAEHDYEWVIDQAPSNTEAGYKHQRCRACGYETERTEISAFGINGYSGTYDGLSHTVDASALPEGAQVMYGLEPLDGASFSPNEAPEFRDACDVTVYFEALTTDGVRTAGSVQVTISPREVKPYWGISEFVWDDVAHAPLADVANAVEGDDVELVVSGAQTDVNEGGAAYVATITGVSGEAAGNYRLPAKPLTCEFFIKRAESSAPSVSGSNESIKGCSDGRLTSLVAGMEWRASGAAAWTSVTSDAVEGLTPGTYEVRWAATGTHNASLATTVTIAAGRMLAVKLPEVQTGYTITAADAELTWRGSTTLTFELAAGYSKTDAFAVEVNGTTVQVSEDGTILLDSVETDVIVTVEGVADLTKPVITGIEDEQTYCISASFTVNDTVAGTLTVRDGEKIMTPEADGTYRLDAGTHKVSVSDEAGNVTTKTVTVNATHLPDADGWRSDADGHWHVCACGQKFDQAAHELKWVVDREATNKVTGLEHQECTTCGYRLADVEIPLVAPKMIEGMGQGWQQGDPADAAFRSDADFEDFLRVEVDGVELSAANYAVSSGSTVVTLKAAYLQTLAVGEHQLSIVSANGAATTTFTVAAAPQPEPTPEPAPTPQPDQKPGSDGAKADGTGSAPEVPAAGDASLPSLAVGLVGGALALAAGRSSRRQR